MINVKYKLTSPRCIEAFFTEVSNTPNDVLVKPEMLSICKADMRYYFGTRDAKVMKEKLPLSLIHEAVGVVLYDPNNIYHRGDKVVMLPNIPGADTCIGENYRLDSRYRSSREDGFMQEVMSMPPDQLVRYSTVPTEIASFTELISVGVHAIHSYMQNPKCNPRKIGVWGDGSMGYIIATLLKYYMPQVEVTVIGIQRNKLELFGFADRVLTVDEISHGDVWFDAAFECVGGQSSERAISQIIDVIQPEGMISLLGVSEAPIAINTRMVLEKGLTLVGRSRSTRNDFKEAVTILETSEKLVRQMKVLISDVVEIHNIKDINAAFEKAKAADYKVIMGWKV